MPNPDIGPRNASSWWALTWDLWSAHALVWLARPGEGELTPDGNLYFFDRYHRLAAYHRARGNFSRAVHFERKAADYDQGDGPPYAAAMAMPRPPRFMRVNAVSRTLGRGDDVA